MYLNCCVFFVVANLSKKNAIIILSINWRCYFATANMAIKKIQSGWLVDVQPGGRGGRRMRKTFLTQEEACVWLASKGLMPVGEVGNAVYGNGPRPSATEKYVELDNSGATYLSIDEITVLLRNLRELPNKDAYLIAKICLATGAKWGEIEAIKRDQLNSVGIELISTPKVNARFIPLEDQFFDELICFAAGIKKYQRVFKDSYRAFRRVTHKSGISLPEWQLTHVLRNTFASYFLMNGGGLPALKNILGHKTISATVKYAFVMSEDVAQAKEFNPLVMLRENGN
jgi:hypothetical protein